MRIELVLVDDDGNAARLPDKETMAAWIRQERTARGMSIPALAAEVGTSRQLVHQWENGTCYPRMPYLEAIIVLFGAPPVPEGKPLEWGTVGISYSGAPWEPYKPVPVKKVVP